ncbi:MAG: DUF4234 domain-containing protein [Clostridia bacterium]|nr:DUF4234 domain-containing protein [Clostridia bacterium]
MPKGTFRSPALVVILGLVTCGIYFFYWIYKVSDEMKSFNDDPGINPGMELLLSIITCGLYTIYWFYKYGKIIAQAQAQVGMTPEDNSILYLVLAIFGLSIVNTAIMQASMNKLWAQA